MPTIDADAHVIESERTWEYIDADQSRPSLIIPTGGKRQYWLIDGRVRPRNGNVSDLFPPESRELIDVGARLRHMDIMGIDIQVLYPSILQAYTDRPEVELEEGMRRSLAWCKAQGILI